MPKIKLKEQTHYEFTYNTTINVRDINYGGHMGNDAVISIIHEARMHLLKELGVTELDLGDGQTGLIMNELGVNYKAEGFLFDEITVHSHLDNFTTASFRIYHKITKNDKTLVLAETGFVTFNYDDHVIVEIPDNFTALINNKK